METGSGQPEAVGSTGPERGSAPARHIEELSAEECASLLDASQVGRIAMMLDEYPVVVPVNYWLVENAGAVLIAMRTRSDSLIDKGPTNVAFQVDGVDTARRQGWSVLVRGKLRHADADTTALCESMGLQTWLAGRDSWVVIEPIGVTGRRLLATPVGSRESPEDEEVHWLLEMSEELGFASPKAQRKILRKYYSQ